MPLTISTRTLGRQKPLLDDFSAPPPDVGDGDSLRLRDVIEHVVRAEVRRFRQRQSDRRLDRVLSETRIATDAALGKVDPAASHLEQTVNADQAVSAALQAFEDGLYLVIIDEIERRNLDDVVYLTADSRLTFIRLTFLAGA